MEAVVDKSRMGPAGLASRLAQNLGPTNLTQSGELRGLLVALL